MTSYRIAGTAAALALPFVALLLLVSLDVTRHVLAAAAPSDQDVSRDTFPANVGLTLRSLPELANGKLPLLLTPHLDLLELRGPHSRLSDYLIPPILSISFDRPRLETLYANRSRIALPPGGNATGFWTAAPACFGILPRDLTTGEAVVLCRLALATTFPHPDSLLSYRQVSLETLKAAGALSPAAFEVESERPLALAPDHVPIW